MAAKGEMGSWEFGINHKVLLKSTGNYSQSPEINHSGKESKKERTYVYN